MAVTKVIIVGGGNAGMQVADSVRRSGYEGTIDLFCEEQHLPYQRPPLSKKYLEGELKTERLFLRPPTFYETKQINVHSGIAIKAINRDKKTVLATDGQEHTYDKLVLATGARVRALPGASESMGLQYIRSIDDIESLKERLAGAPKRIVLVGGGFIGLETAATLNTLGHSVTVIEAMPTIMPGLVAPELAGYIRGKHSERGTKIIENTPVQEIAYDNGLYSVTLADETCLQADVVIVGIGVIPNSEIAAAAGIECDRGILVDAHACTNDPDIYAVGDCANGMHMRFGAHTRLESVQNAVDQATVAGKTIAGEEVCHDALPWFWSDQYDMKLQMAGLSRGYDDSLVRGDMASGKFSICYFKGDQLIAVDSLNAVPDHMAARRLLTAGITVMREQCADAETPLKTYLS
ncbi:NAD(P)/FAD-dependent oxidoreductase [Kordiimonas aquimaris]|uniref:NAD(P)/FAD-dependent oxidoreductase n=1 Tax=Kordiimonas aquimaris TaxID=707591 RepID=UPI0021D3E266|nr:FAD-dependent oxidoreductase [Kordiimonas aquimaris]